MRSCGRGISARDWLWVTTDFAKSRGSPASSPRRRTSCPCCRGFSRPANARLEADSAAIADRREQSATADFPKFQRQVPMQPAGRSRPPADSPPSPPAVSIPRHIRLHTTPRPYMRTPIVLAAALTLIAQAAPLAAQADTTALLARARRLHAQYPLVDGHNDLPWEIREKGFSDLNRMDPNGPLPGNHTDVARLKQGGVGGVFWAAYVPVETMGHAPGPARVALEQIDLIHRMVQGSPDMEMALTANEIERAHHNGRIAALIGIEGGHAIENSLGSLRQFHALGVRYMTLTHTSTIDWADAATDRE